MKEKKSVINYYEIYFTDHDKVIEVEKRGNRINSYVGHTCRFKNKEYKNKEEKCKLISTCYKFVDFFIFFLFVL